MTSNARPESEQLVVSAEDVEEATSTPERSEGGCHPPRRLKLSVGTRGSRGNNTATDLEKAVTFAPSARDKSRTNFPDPRSNGETVVPSCSGDRRAEPDLQGSHKHVSEPIARRKRKLRASYGTR